MGPPTYPLGVLALYRFREPASCDPGIQAAIKQRLVAFSAPAFGHMDHSGLGWIPEAVARQAPTGAITQANRLWTRRLGPDQPALLAADPTAALWLQDPGRIGLFTPVPLRLPTLAQTRWSFLREPLPDGSAMLLARELGGMDYHTQLAQMQQTVFEQLPEGLWMLDPEGAICLTNQRALDQLGTGAPELVQGRSWLELIAAGNQPALQREWAHLQSGQIQALELDTELLRFDSQSLPVRLHLRTEPGRSLLVRWMVSITDLSSVREHEKQLQDHALQFLTLNNMAQQLATSSGEMAILRQTLRHAAVMLPKAEVLMFVGWVPGQTDWVVRLAQGLAHPERIEGLPVGAASGARRLESQLCRKLTAATCSTETSGLLMPSFHEALSAAMNGPDSLTALLVPAFLDDKPMGALLACTRDDNAFSGNELSFLEVLMTQVGLGLDRARQQQLLVDQEHRLIRRERTLQTVARFTNSTAEAQSAEAVLESLLQAAAEIAPGMEARGVALYDLLTDDLVVRQCAGLDQPRRLLGLRLGPELAANQLRLAYQQKRTILLNDLREPGAQATLAPLLPLTSKLPRDLHEMLIVPIRSEGVPIGILAGASRSRPGLLTPEDIAPLELLASQAGLALSRVELTRQVSERQERINQDLEAARQIQWGSQAPAATDLGSGWSLQTLYEPSARIGGDLVQVAELRDGRRLLLVADMAGHGIPVALESMRLQGHLQLLLDQVTTPAEVLSGLNTFLCAIRKGAPLMCTALCIVLDPTTGLLTVANAGHPAPLLWREATGVVDPLFADGLPLGIDPALPFAETSLHLQAGDRLLAYTDGLSETRHPDRVHIPGEDALRRIIEVYRGLHPAHFMAQMELAVRRYRHFEPPTDDLACCWLTAGEPGWYGVDLSEENFELALSLFDAWPGPPDLVWRHRVKQGFHEALLNAVEHGAQEVREQVQVRYRLHKGCLQVVIYDRGEGFPAPDEEAIEAMQPTFGDRGRGLLFIREFTDRHWWNRLGNAIALEWVLPNGDREHDRAGDAETLGDLLRGLLGRQGG